jgi:hypothetical protein
MPEKGLKFLLDQGFPKPKLAVDELQADVTFEHFNDHAPEFANTSTPDWMIYLIAEAGGFDGVITQDFRQVEQQEELVALSRTRLSVVTWKTGLNDPVTAWALIVAYMPMIKRAIEEHGQSIFLLPVPRSFPENQIHKATDRARELASKAWEMSYPEATRASLELMRSELKRRGKEALGTPLEREPRKGSRRAKKDSTPKPTPKEEEPSSSPPDPLFPPGGGS